MSQERFSLNVFGETCQAYVGTGAGPEVGRAVVVIDGQVLARFPHTLPEHPRLVVDGGEAIKGVPHLEALWRFFALHDVDRETLVIGVGGGTVADLVGFAASTWHRGVPFALVATTLLAQVDAALGGKNGLNLHGFKNQVGTIALPRWVACDPDYLRTLPEEVYRAGLAEVVKYALLGSPGLFTRLEFNLKGLLTRDSAVLTKVIAACVEAKHALVEADPLERGPRTFLNLGHTLGHAYEALLGVSHGEAVSAGLIDALALSAERRGLSLEVLTRTRALLDALGLPTKLNAPAEALLEAIKRDKKRAGKTIRFVLLNAVGEPVIEALTLEALERYLRRRTP